MVNIRGLLALVTVQLSHLGIANALTTQQIATDLSKTLSAGSEIVLVTDPAFERDFTQRFSAGGTANYSLGVKPATVQDVQKTVQFARKNYIPFLATGGGHGYTWSLGKIQDGIQLDLGNFRKIEIDTVQNTMTVGGAVVLGDVTGALQAVNREFPVGMCPTVGIAGFTFGGGVGPLGGIHGPASDALLSVELVTGTGQILNVSATSHPDLFYGLRGAGFNYGVATSLKYKIFPATNNDNVTIIDAIFPGSLNRSVWKAYGDFVHHHPKELSILSAIRYNQTMGGMIIVGSFIYAGPRDAALKVIKPLLDLKPLSVEVKPATYHTVGEVAIYGDVAGIGILKHLQFAPYMVNLYKVDVDNLVNVFTWMDKTLKERPELQPVTLSWAQYSDYGYNLLPDAVSAFPFRDIVTYFSIDGFAGYNSTLLPTLNTFSKEIRDRVQKGSGKPQLEVYVHFAHGDEGPTAWYTARKLPILKALKALYDPYNIFSNYNSITARKS